MKRYLSIAAILIQFALGEDLTIIVNRDQSSYPIAINQGDTAKLEFAFQRSPSGSFSMICTINGQEVVMPCYQVCGPGSVYAPATIAGPATIVFREYNQYDSGTCIATLRITRAGTASPPVAIPQEAGSKFDVILESSSDLINWTPANPGEYSGTEPKRFFRTRIVKKP